MNQLPLMMLARVTTGQGNVLTVQAGMEIARRVVADESKPGFQTPSLDFGSDFIARLKNGVGAWNAWRDENRDIRPNLREANLSEANLVEAKLVGADLGGAEPQHGETPRGGPHRDKKLVDRIAAHPLSTEDLHSTWKPSEWEDIIAWWDEMVTEARMLSPYRCQPGRAIPRSVHWRGFFHALI